MTLISLNEARGTWDYHQHDIPVLQPQAREGDEVPGHRWQQRAPTSAKNVGLPIQRSETLFARRHATAARRTSPCLDGVRLAPKVSSFCRRQCKTERCGDRQPKSPVPTEAATFRSRSIRGSRPGGSSLLTEGMKIPICLRELRDPSLLRSSTWGVTCGAAAVNLRAMFLVRRRRGPGILSCTPQPTARKPEAQQTHGETISRAVADIGPC